MMISSNQMEKEAAESKDGVKKIVNAAAAKKRADRLKREAAAKKRGR